MARCTTDTCVLTLPLALEKWQADRLDKRFELGRQLYNTLLGKELKKYNYLCNSTEYKENQAVLQELFENKKKATPEYKTAAKRRQTLLREGGLTEFGFSNDMTPLYKCFKQNIDSDTAQVIAKDVWRAFDTMLYGRGDRVHFKRHGELNSLASRHNTAGIKYRNGHIVWNGLDLCVRLTPDNNYETRMLEHEIKYCRLLRRPGKTKTRYFVQLALEGRPEQKFDITTGEVTHPSGVGRVGLDIGMQTLAYVSNTEVGLIELADKAVSIEREKRIIQRKMDRSRRATNPDNYCENGTIKRGVALHWNKSNRYKQLARELKYLQCRQAETRKTQHNILANHLLSLGDEFFVEDMDYRALARRAQKTEVSEKTGRFKRKKRFGKSVANKAPATLISILDQKLVSRDMAGVVKVPTRAAASQYDHKKHIYQKKKLSQRWHTTEGGDRIQRDIYSAFLLQNIGDDLKHFNDEALEKSYDSFLVLHNAEMERLVGTDAVYPSSMGVGSVRTAGKHKNP